MIVIVFTGGTISMRHDPVAGGAVPSLSGKEILSLAPGLDKVAAVEVDDWAAHPGPHMTPERVWELRAKLIRHVARPEVEGVVVTHGTDALEETAYVIARSVDTQKPIVFTGAMRTSSELGWDGPANLSAAVRVANSPDARGRGVLVAMSDRVFSAFDITKTNTHMLDAFASPVRGPIGVLDDGVVLFGDATEGGCDQLLPVLTPKEFATPIDIVYAYSGADSRLIDASRAEARGLVVAAMGRGNVPPAMMPGIERWIADNKPVVITSRAGRGRVGQTYGYPGAGRRLGELGAIFGGGLRPVQARIELMLGLGAGLEGESLRALFAHR